MLRWRWDGDGIKIFDGIGQRKCGSAGPGNAASQYRAVGYFESRVRYQSDNNLPPCLPAPSPLRRGSCPEELRGNEDEGKLREIEI